MLNPREIDLSEKKWNPGPKSPVCGVSAAVSSDNAVVTNTMLKVMASGGNAVDATIAGCMVQAAVEPFMTNHTGTVTFLFYHAKEDKYYQLDSVGTFPPDLPAHMPVPQGMGNYAESQPRSILPGFMPGLKALHGKFATKPWAELCEEAIWFAENGHHVSQFEADVNCCAEDFITFFPEGRKFYMPDGHMPTIGERFGSQEMADTLKKVAEEGPDYMITGAWADHFIEKANSMGWMITKEHMKATDPRWIEPLRYTVGEFEFVSLAPPQQQGVFIALVLGILNKLNISSYKPYSAHHIFYMAQALELAQQVCGFLNDPEVLTFDVNTFLDENFHGYLATLIRGLEPRVDLTQHMKLTSGYFASYTGKVPTPRQNSHQSQPSGSCELSIVDSEGNWVQMMNTLQAGGIPGQVVDGIPMVGSHSLPNIPASPMNHYLVPGARQRTMMGNTMVLKDGKPIFQLGSPGNVHVTVPQVLCNYLFFGMTPYEAISAPRMLGVMNGSFIIEDRLDENVQEELLAMGLRTAVSNEWDYHMGSFQVCYIDQETGELCAVADPRRCGVADGLQ